MSVYGVVLTLLLAFPWAFVGVALVGAAWSVVARKLGNRGKEAVTICVGSSASWLGSRRPEIPQVELPADAPHIGPCHGSVPRAA